MHICLLTHEYPPEKHGGIGTLVADLAEGCADAGHAVTVFAVNAEKRGGRELLQRREERRAGVRVIRLWFPAPAWMRWRPGVAWQRWQLLRLLRAEHRVHPFDVIEVPDACGWLPFGRVRDVPVVTRLDGAMFFFDHVMQRLTGDPFTHWLERRSLARSDHLVGISHYVAREEMALSWDPRAPVEIIYCSVDTDFHCPDPAVAVEEGLIVFVNSVQYRKGVYELCRAMNIVAAQQPTARLLLIGRAYGDHVVGELQALIRPEYRNRVQFIGWLETPAQVRDYLRRAQVCCYPSRLECFGIAPVEAMATGKATIYTKFGPGPEVIEDGVSGLLCDPASPEDIAAKLLAVLGDPALAARLGAAARERAVRRFDRKDWMARNLALYGRCAARRQAG